MPRVVQVTLFAAIAAIVGVLCSTTQASPLSSGTTIDGWTITYSNPGISLALDPADGSIQLVLEKFAAFANTNGLLVTFTQSGTTGIAPKIELLTESVTNVTGTSWQGFEYQLLTPLGAATTFEGPAGIFTPPNTGPGVNYTSVSFSSTDIVYSGSQANNSTAFWGTTGATLGGSLIMDTHPTASGSPAVFTLKEVPILATVPLPAAGWQGMGTLLVLGMFAGYRRFRGAVH